MHPDIQSVANQLSIPLEAIDQASNLASSDIDKIRKSLHKKFPLKSGELSPIDVVFCGSYGRGEATKGSDRDYFVILHGPTTPTRSKEIFREVEKVCDEIGIEKPGTGGLFREVVSSGELHIRIGLEGDTNTNTTRRLLFLTESVSAYCENTYQDLLRTIIKRYCTDYNDDERAHDSSRLPHFLLNDLARYWRTIAVDFGAKKWRALAPDWHVRYAKLRTSRKLMFAGSLASLFLTPTACKNGLAVDEHLRIEFSKPVLARLCGTYGHLDSEGKDALRAILLAYNRFIEILHQQGKRDLLAKGETIETRMILEEMRKLGDKIQEGLESLFYSDKKFSGLTRRYGLF